MPAPSLAALSAYQGALRVQGFVKKPVEASVDKIVEYAQELLQKLRGLGITAGIGEAENAGWIGRRQHAVYNIVREGCDIKVHRTRLDRHTADSVRKRQRSDYHRARDISDIVDVDVTG
jgi:hypothetical protein